jgi:hypothetical protein
MNDSTGHFLDIVTHEQIGMGVQTGLSKQQALVFIEEKICRWKEVDRLDVVLLRALCKLTMSNCESAHRGFNATDLVDAIVEIRKRAWSDRKDKARMSDDVRISWNKLIKTWESKSEGISQQLSDAGFAHFPTLQKTEGGGTGNYTVYRIEWAVTAPPTAAPQLEDSERFSPTEVEFVRYVCEDIEEANPFARIFTSGFRLHGWRRNLYIAMIGVPSLLFFIFLIQIVFSITWGATIGEKNLFTTMLSLCVVWWSVLVTIGPFYRLATDRIVIAPWWMQSLDDDRLLEQRSPPRHPEKSIKAVRYVAQCPICGGKLQVRKAPLEFRWRIIGRCDEAPIEHVFSFDHITRRGSYLR